ncbi:MAG TPA: LuxR C-terminal-related transcriptional regulator [Acidimicrobiales bacterium]|nr:LuxR C-terminal-related transcriptional regulator [Acidimicrobiales bacterium]
MRTWPLVGREEELAVVAEARATPGCSGVVVAGAAGVGKSRLLKEAVARAARDGCATSSVGGFAATSGIPLAAFAAYPVSVPSDDEAELLQAAAASVVRAARGRRLVLSVDDAHVLDPRSAALVHRLAVAGTAFLIVGVRSGEPAPDPVVALWEHGLAARLELQSLSRGEVARLVADALGGYVDVRTAQELWRESEGNPLFLRELVLQGVESATLVHDGDVWRRTGAVPAGNRLVEVIGARIGQLDPAERRLAELLAVAGSLDVATVHRLATDGAVASLEARGILTTETDRRRTQVRLAHPLYAEVLRPHLVLRARALRTALADALEATPLRRAGDLLRLATWRLDSLGQLDPALAVASGRQAEALLDHELAERLARAAVDAGGGFEAELLLAEALTGRRDGEAAEFLLARLGEQAVDDDRRTRVVLVRARNLLFNLHRASDGHAVLAAANETVTDVDCRDELALLQGQLAQYDGRYGAALAAVLPVVERPGISDGRLVRGMAVAANAFASRGERDRAEAAADRGLQAATRLGRDLRLVEASLLSCKWRMLMRERMVDAEALALETFQRALDEGCYEVAVQFAMPVGTSALFQGKVRTAQRRISEALALVRRHDVAGQERPVLLALTEATALAGDVAAAADLYDQGLGLGAFETFEPWLARARGWVEAARGAVGEARRLCREAADVARSQGQIPAEASALHDLVRLGGVSTDVAGRLSELPPDPLGDIYAAHAEAALSGSGSCLDGVAASFALIGANLWAAEAAAMAASAHRETGRQASARASAERARSLLAHCEGARTPALAALDGDHVRRLTDRQRHIAGLAAVGLPSREIAERLGLSVRTVDNQLARVYSALGVAGRSELAAVLGPPGAA